MQAVVIEQIQFSLCLRQLFTNMPVIAETAPMTDPAQIIENPLGCELFGLFHGFGHEHVTHQRNAFTQLYRAPFRF